MHRCSKADCDVNGVPKEKGKGGSFNQKMFQVHKEFIVSLLQNPYEDINSVQRIGEKFFEEFEAKVDDSTVWRAMHGLCHAKKKETDVSVTAINEVKLEKKDSL